MTVGVRTPLRWPAVDLRVCWRAFRQVGVRESVGVKSAEPEYRDLVTEGDDDIG